MKSFNLTEWALKHKELIYYFMAAIFVMGIFSYQKLGRLEDPDFVIRQMVVSASWPGASAKQVEEQVTDKIEKNFKIRRGLTILQAILNRGRLLFLYI